MNDNRYESRVISLVCFLAVSARGLMEEPKIYGPMRLMDATQRMIELAEDFGIHHELLKEVARQIKGFSLDALPEGEEEFIKFMDALVVLLATWVDESFH